MDMLDLELHMTPYAEIEKILNSNTGSDLLYAYYQLRFASSNLIKLKYGALEHEKSLINHAGDVFSLTTKRPNVVVAQVIAARIHDIVRDSNYTLDDVEENFGKIIREIVDSLTRRVHESYLFEYIPRLAKNPLAIDVKVCDLLHNLSLLPPQHKSFDRYIQTLHHLAKFVPYTQDLLL